MNYLFTICGRAGSKGFKNKNLKNMLGVPLVYYTLATIGLYKEQYGKNDTIRVVLNTDSMDLIKIAKKQDAIEFFTIERTADLSGDTVSKYDVIKDCLVRSEEHYKCKFDMIIDLDLTSPLRTVEDVKAAIEKKKDRQVADVVYSVTHSRRSPYFNMVKEENGFYGKVIKSEYVTRQQAPVLYDMNASIYAYSRETLLNKTIFEAFEKADIIVMRDTAVLDIDGEEDFELMSVIANYLIEKYGEYGKVYSAAKGIMNENE